jgi:hypothetical protein
MAATVKAVKEKTSKPAIALKSKAPDIETYVPASVASMDASGEYSCACGGVCPRCNSEWSDVPISAPDDPFERQADRVADRVMHGPSQFKHGSGDGGEASNDPAPELDRVEQEEELDDEPWLQRKAGMMAGSDEDEGKNGIGSLNPLSGTHGANLATVLSDVGSGFPIPSGDRRFFETRLGFDLGGVRLHTNAQATSRAAALNARAFTLGNDIVVGAGEYAPGSQTGRALLAHELAHVLQQSRGFVQPRVQRLLRVIDASEPPAHLPPPDGQTLRAVLVEGWLGQLCPSGVWRVDRATGIVSLGNRETLCTADGVAASGTPVSTDCVCRASSSEYPQIDIVIEELFPYSRFRFDRNQGIFTLVEDVVDLTSTGEGATLYPQDGAWLDNTTIVLSGRSTRIQGAGDTTIERSMREVRDPPWLILAHELCGHIDLRQRGVEDYAHLETPTGDRSAVDIENRIRREHSTQTDSYGIRAGDTGGFYGSLYVVQQGDTLESVSRRVGLSTGPEVWDENGQHLHIIHWPSGDHPYRDDINELFTPGTEIVIEGIHWHEVISGESWTSIARMWQVTYRALRRANPGVMAVRPGLRLLIPISSARSSPAPTVRERNYPGGGRVERLVPGEYLVWNFDIMQHELKPEHETGLVEIAAEIAAALAHSPLVEVDIEGQASLTGSDEINDPLSQRRAQSVRQALIGDGIDASRMRLASVGRRKSRPAVSQENLARSRAVLIVVEPRFATQQPLPEMPATTPVMTNPIQIGDCTIALSMLAMEGGPVTLRRTNQYIAVQARDDSGYGCEGRQTTTTPGMFFMGNAAVMPENCGSLHFVHNVRPYIQMVFKDGSRLREATSTWVLDSVDPYPTFTPPGLSTGMLAVVSNDSPGLCIGRLGTLAFAEGLISSIELRDEFRMFLMFRPNGGHRRALQSATWWFVGIARNPVTDLPDTETHTGGGRLELDTTLSRVVPDSGYGRPTSGQPVTAPNVRQLDYDIDRAGLGTTRTFADLFFRIFRRER